MLPVHFPSSPSRRVLAACRPRRALAQTASVLVSVLVSVLAACSTPPPSTPTASAPDLPTALLAPPAAMRVEGVPALSAAVVPAFQRYSEVLGHGFADWHPQRREMLISHRRPGASTPQLFRLRSPMGELEPLTDNADPVANARWEPRRGRYIVFSRASGGDEVFQLYRLDPETRATTQLTPNNQRHAALAWVESKSLMLVSSLPIDRTAATGTRSEISTTLSLIDPLNPEARQVLAELPGGGWGGAQVSPDESQVALTRYISANQSEVWLMNLAGPAQGQRRQVLPAAGEKLVASHLVGGWALDGQSLFITSDRASEFRELMRVPFVQGQAGAPVRLSAHIPWDIADGDPSATSRRLAMTANIDGRDELRLFDPNSGAEQPLPAGLNLPPGSVTSVRAHRGTGELAIVVSSARGPAQVHSVNLDSGRVEAWTRPVTPPGLDLASLPEPEIVRWKSFDGRMISGVLYRPSARYAGPRPVVMSLHGGPEGQSKLGWAGRLNYLVQEMGIAVLLPNVRGSSGYGKTFLALDNGRLREDSVKDMGAAIDWIATQNDLDAKRVVVTGGSYGGYMALAASVRLADRIAGAASTVGISNWVSFLERTESYRRDLRRVEYGDERDPAMRQFLLSISPLNLTDNITKPLLVAQGKNDPRVPWTESEQIVRKLQGKSTPVWYLLADNEGHGFARRENADFYFATFLKFLEATVIR